MEWMLQVVDEIDDAVGVVWQCCGGLAAEIGPLLAGLVGIGAIGAALATGAEVPLICSAAILLSLGAALQLRILQLRTGR